MTTHPIIAQDVAAIVDSLRVDAPRLEGKTVLISGGAGFLGSYIVATLQELNRRILPQPCRVIVLDNFITSSREDSIADFFDPNVEFIEHDVRNPLPENLRADYVIHAAGLASPYYYRKFPLETIAVAVEGTKHFLEYCREHQPVSFLYFSSSEVYGNPDPQFIPTPEEYWGIVSQLGPRACYDESKRLGETLCKTYHELFGVPAKIVRPFNVYGPGMRVNDYRVIPTFLARALRGEALPVHDRGNQTRTFCYVSDAVQGFLKILLSGRTGEAYNVGRDDEEINMVSLATIISRIAPRPVEVSLVPYPESYPGGEPQRRCPKLEKIKRELGYEPRVDLKTGLERTMQWYQSIMPEERKSALV